MKNSAKVLVAFNIHTENFVKAHQLSLGFQCIWPSQEGVFALLLIVSKNGVSVPGLSVDMDQKNHRRVCSGYVTT